MTPAILYNNILSDGTLSASSTASGYNINNILDRKTYTCWKADASGAQTITIEFVSGKTLNSYAIVGHNFADCGATIKLEMYKNSTWSTIDSDYTVGVNTVIFRSVSLNTVDKLRLTMTTSSVAPKLAVFMVGVKMSFPYPPDAPFAPIVQGVEAKSEISKTGHLLGVDKRFNPFTISAKFSDIPISFKSALDTFYAAMTTKPFIWSYMGDYYVRLSSGYLFQAPQSLSDYIETFTLDMEGAVK